MADENIAVHYCCGVQFEVFGRFQGLVKTGRGRSRTLSVAVEILESKVTHAGVLSPGQVALIDPRCVLLGERSGVLYEPRRFVRKMPPKLREWMRENESWPPAELVGE